MTSAPILEDADRVPGRPDITAWRRAARLHQHLWREAHGWPVGAQRRPARLGGGMRTIGSRVDEVHARDKGTNFVVPAAWELAAERVNRPQAFQTLDESGLFADLLHPVALACNLLGPLWADEQLARAALSRWFRDMADEGQRCEIEIDWSPGRRNRRWLDDTTSFEAAFRLTGGRGERLIGMSVRYHEYPESQPLVSGPADRPVPRRPGDRLMRVTERAQLFRGDQWFDQVFGTELERIWRAHALAHSCLHIGSSVTSVLHVLVAPSANAAWADAADRYGKLLSNQARPTFAFRTLEQLIDQGDDVLPHADELRARYVDVAMSQRVAKPSSKTNGQHVYVIGEVDGLPAVKIGVSDRPRSRLSDFATGNPRELEILHTEAMPNARWVEHQLHAALAPWRLATNPEWYDIRQLVVGGDWHGLIDRALAGLLPGAGPSAVPAGIPGHELVHVDGKVRAFRSSCTCGWKSASGSIPEVLGEFEAHVGAAGPLLPDGVVLDEHGGATLVERVSDADAPVDA
jgi:hypothetical protein